MSRELKDAKCCTGPVNMNSFYGGFKRGTCVQLTFKCPDEEQTRPTFGWWYMQLTRDQARELAQALIEFAEDRRDYKYDYIDNEELL